VKTPAEQIRRQIPTEEFDYQALSDSLKDYARPRDRISDLISREQDVSAMNEVANHCRSRKVALLASFLRRFKESSHE
jgi:hypothetical protein